MDLQGRGLVHDDVVVRLVDDAKVGVVRATHRGALAPLRPPANRRLAFMRRIAFKENMNLSTERVVIVGASDKPDRYAYLAFKMLREHGHEVLPVHPRLHEIEGVPVVAEISQISGAVETVTLYVGPAISSGLAEALITLHPRRVIMNPGTENPELESKLSAAGIDVQHACTLVLLRTGHF